MMVDSPVASSKSGGTVEREPFISQCRTRAVRSSLEERWE